MKNKFKDTVHTDKSLSQETIDAYKKRFTAIDPKLDPGPSLYFLFNHNKLRYEYLDGAVAYIFGYSIDEFQKLKDPYFKFFHDDDLPIYNDLIFPQLRELRMKYANEVQHLYYQILGRIKRKDGKEVNTLLEYQLLEIGEDIKPILSFGKLTELGMPRSVRGIGISMYYYDGKLSKLVYDEIFPYAQSKISKRELEIVKLIAEGKSGKEIAELLFISENTVKNHRQSIFRKLGLKSTPELVRYALEQGLTK